MKPGMASSERIYFSNRVVYTSTNLSIVHLLISGTVPKKTFYMLFTKLPIKKQDAYKTRSVQAKPLTADWC